MRIGSNLNHPGFVRKRQIVPAVAMAMFGMVKLLGSPLSFYKPGFHVFGSLLLQKGQKSLPSSPHSPPAQIDCIILYKPQKKYQEINRILVGSCNHFHLKGVGNSIGVDTYSML